MFWLIPLIQAGLSLVQQRKNQENAVIQAANNEQPVQSQSPMGLGKIAGGQ